jgi:hypothetical protein
MNFQTAKATLVAQDTQFIVLFDGEIYRVIGVEGQVTDLYEIGELVDFFLGFEGTYEILDALANM